MSTLKTRFAAPLITSPLRTRFATVPVRLRHPGGPPAVLGHKGASKYATANTAESFLTATRQGADGIELDLIVAADGDVLVAHDLGDVSSRPDALRLSALTDLLAEAPLSNTPVLLDVKSRGSERALAAALIGARLTPRAIISTTDPGVLKGLKLAAPGATRSQTFPRSRRDPERHLVSRRLARLRQPLTRAILPFLVRLAVRRYGLAAVTVNHRLVTRTLRDLTRRHDVELIVWTVDDLPDVDRMLALDVDAIITNDPPRVLQARTKALVNRANSAG